MVNIAIAFLSILLHLVEYGSISGVVTDTVNPVPGVSVKLIDAANNHVVSENITDRWGAFSFATVENGVYFISASMPVFRECVRGVTISGNQTVNLGELKLKVAPPTEIFNPVDFPVGPSMKELFPHIRQKRGALVMTVCEFLKVKVALSSVNESFPIVMLGYLRQTEQGEWLEQSCEDSLKTGEFIWPNAINLQRIDDKNSWRLDLPAWESDFVNGLTPPKIEERNSANHQGRWVAAYGRLDSRESLAVIPCNSQGKLCGYGFGQVNTPAQLSYISLHFFGD
jgi:hypothetical protein